MRPLERVLVWYVRVPEAVSVVVADAQAPRHCVRRPRSWLVNPLKFTALTITLASRLRRPREVRHCRLAVHDMVDCRLAHHDVEGAVL